MIHEPIYSGDARPQHCEYDVYVRVGNSITLLPPRNDLRNHSPTGLSWGYAGSGPAQCALALLAHATNDDQLALKHYQLFKAQVVARLPASWTLTASEILQWIKEHEHE